MTQEKTINELMKDARQELINKNIADIEEDRKLTLMTTNLSKENKEFELLMKELENKIYDEVVKIIKKQVK